MKTTLFKKIVQTHGRASLLALLLLLLAGGCQLDNYEPADAKLTGVILDETTFAPFQTRTPNGARVRFYEKYNGVWSPQPYDLWVHQDGTFTNNAFFSGDYKVVAEGAFFPIDTQIVRIADTRKLALLVTPYLSIDIQATTSLRRINATARISKAEGAGNIEEIMFLLSDTPNVDVNSWMRKGGEESLTQTSDDEIIATDYVGFFGGLDVGRTYYVRAAARAKNDANEYNYSEIIPVKVEE